jgi:hypothetical protein
MTYSCSEALPTWKYIHVLLSMFLTLLWRTYKTFGGADGIRGASVGRIRVHAVVNKRAFSGRRHSVGQRRSTVWLNDWLLAVLSWGRRGMGMHATNDLRASEVVTFHSVGEDTVNNRWSTAADRDLLWTMDQRVCRPNRFFFFSPEMEQASLRRREQQYKYTMQGRTRPRPRRDNRYPN